jgi:hypothetical protein
MMVAMLEEAHRAGQLRDIDIAGLPLMARALVYGLARIRIDGQFAQWGGEANAQALSEKTLDDFVALLAR